MAAATMVVTTAAITTGIDTMLAEPIDYFMCVFVGMCLGLAGLAYFGVLHIGW